MKRVVNKDCRCDWIGYQEAIIEEVDLQLS